MILSCAIVAAGWDCVRLTEVFFFFVCWWLGWLILRWERFEHTKNPTRKIQLRGRGFLHEREGTKQSSWQKSRKMVGGISIRQDTGYPFIIKGGNEDQIHTNTDRFICLERGFLYNGFYFPCKGKEEVFSYRWSHWKKLRFQIILVKNRTKKWSQKH